VKVTPTNIPGVVVIEPSVFSDTRGSFRTVFHAIDYAAAGVEYRFVQDNVSESRRGVLRGLHFQHPRGQGKLVYALSGEVFDVAVDVRFDSPTFGRAVWTTLSEENHRQVFIPPGFAHGFAVTSEHAVIAYKCSAPYAPDCEQVVRWNDPTFDIPWPVLEPILAPRDADAPPLANIPAERLPRVGS